MKKGALRSSFLLFLAAGILLYLIEKHIFKRKEV